MTEVGWGVLGAGWLVNTATAEAIHRASGARLVAAAARDQHRAEAIGPTRAYDSYQAVIEDPDVDAVYIALANDAHLPWIHAAVAAGKHVLCEKPLVLSREQAQEAFDAARLADVMLVEAAWSRWHPRIQRVVELASSGDIGELSSFLGSFTFSGVPQGNYRLSRARGGGALFDIGVYPLHVLVACLPDHDDLDAIDVVMELDTLAPKNDAVDLTTKATLGWGEGTHASVMASFTMPESQRLELGGTDATLRIDDEQAFTSWRAPSRLLVADRVEEFPAVNAYQLMFEEFSAAVRDGSGWVIPPRDSLRVARAMDSIRHLA